MITFLTSLNYKLLISTYTNSALDNIFIKLKTYNSNALRLGNKFKCHPEIINYTEEEIFRGCKSVEDVKNIMQNITVIGATMNHLSSSPNIIQSTKFDYAIIDEASQATLPACLAPVLKAEKFILVGDTKQLAPLLIKSTGESLLERLSAFCTNNCKVDMVEQYRMNDEILRLSNQLFYSNNLISGGEYVSNLQLKLNSYETTDDFEKFISNPNHSVCTILTDKLGLQAAEFRSKNGIFNKFEAKVATDIVRKFLNVSTVKFF